MTKKTTIFLLSLLLGAASIGKAQNSKISLSVEGGPSQRSIIVSTALRSVTKATLGFYAGVTAQYQFNKTWSVVTGIGFEHKGSAYETLQVDDNGNAITTWDTRLNYEYLTMPILARVTFGNKVKVFFNAGVYSGLLLDTKYVRTLPNTPRITVSNKSNMKSTDGGLSIGGGVKMEILTKISALVEIRNNYGLAIVNTDSNITRVGSQISTQNVCLILGLTYDLSDK